MCGGNNQNKRSGKMANELHLSGIDDVMRVASIAVKSNTFAFKNPEEAAIKIMYGLEMGLPVFAALTGVVLIQGKPTMSSNLIASLIKRSGRYDYTVPQWDETRCTIVFTQHGKTVGESTFTMDDAHRAGLLRGGSNWDKYPRAMLFARAITQGARAYCADVFVGPVYDPEELTPEAAYAAPTPPTVTVNATPVSTPVSAPVPLERRVHILAATLTEAFGDDRVKKENFVIRLYDQLSNSGTAQGSAADSRAMYAEIVSLVDSGKVTPLDLKMALQFDATPVIKEIEAKNADSGDTI